MIEKLPPRERQVFDALCARGEATAAQIEASLPEASSNSAVRIMLSRLEKKGFVTHRKDRQTFIYSVALPTHKVRQSVLNHLVRTFFHGSPGGAAVALIGMFERVDPAELDRLEEVIAQARKRQRDGL